MVTNTTPSVAARGLTQRIGRTTILNGIDLQISGGVVGLLGPNGAGKTTLLRTLATVLSPASGELQLLGHDRAVVDTDQVVSFRKAVATISAERGVRLLEVRPLDDDLESVFKYLVGR